MVRIGGPVVVFFVTGITVGGDVDVVIVYVALIAGYGLVCAREWKNRLIVIEGCGNPCGGVVADFALLRESDLRMIRVVGVVVVRQVAGDARRVCQLVISVDMALRTLQWSVRSRERPSGLAVIELRPRPGRCAVTSVASGGESRLRVIWIGGGVVVLHVACAARAAGQVVVAVHVALFAWQIRVCSG